MSDHRANDVHGGALPRGLLEDEDRGEFEQLLAAYMDRYRPVDDNENFLVGRMVFARWRLSRLADLETRIVSVHHHTAMVNVGWANSITDLMRDIFLDEEHLERCGPRHAGHPPDVVAHAYVRDCEKGNAITKLSRYQVTLERSYYRALRQLERSRR
jgi:hypothetical protein